MDNRPMSAVVVTPSSRERVFMELRTRHAPVPHSSSISPVRPMTEEMCIRDSFFICNEANGETTKDDKWTQIIDGMAIYTDTALKEYLEKAGFCQIQSHKNKKGWLCVTAQKR